MNLIEIKNKLFDQQDLSFEEASFVFNLIMNGEVGEIDTASILISLKIKNESKDEIHGAAKIMREKSLKILSPGPCTPNEAGICMDIVKKLHRKFPILGICLGHQSIGQAFGGNIIQCSKIIHGKV